MERTVEIVTASELSDLYCSGRSKARLFRKCDKLGLECVNRLFMDSILIALEHGTSGSPVNSEPGLNAADELELDEEMEVDFEEGQEDDTPTDRLLQPHEISLYDVPTFDDQAMETDYQLADTDGITIQEDHDYVNMSDFEYEWLQYEIHGRQHGNSLESGAGYLTAGEQNLNVPMDLGSGLNDHYGDVGNIQPYCDEVLATYGTQLEEDQYTSNTLTDLSRL